MSKKHVKNIIQEMVISECDCTSCALFSSTDENKRCINCVGLDLFIPNKQTREYIREKTNAIIVAFNLR
jgi:hypothetical protein